MSNAADSRVRRERLYASGLCADCGKYPYECDRRSCVECLERKRGAGGIGSGKRSQGSVDAWARLEATGRCACGLLLPCFDCPLEVGAVGFMRQGGSNLGEHFGSGGAGRMTHQWERRKKRDE